MAARVLYSYASTEADELMLRKNEVVDVLEEVEEEVISLTIFAYSPPTKPPSYVFTYSASETTLILYIHILCTHITMRMLIFTYVCLMRSGGGVATVRAKR